MTTPAYFTSNANSAVPGSTVLVWSPQGALGRLGTTIAPAGWKVYDPTRFGGTEYLVSTYVQAIQVPPDAAPGQYVVQPAGPTAGEIVTPTPPPCDPLTVTVVPKPVLKRIASGSIGIPGFTGITAPVTLNNTIIDGLNKQLTVLELDTYRIGPNVSAFIPDGDFVIRNVTFVGVDFRQYVFHRWPLLTSGRFLIENCDFVNCLLGAFAVGDSELTIRNCNFYEATATPWVCGSVVYDNCKHCDCTLRGAEQQAFVLQGCGQALVMNNDWIRTNQGLIIQTDRPGYSIANVLSVRNRFEGVRGGEANASECFLIESGAATVSNVTDYGADMEGCSGPGLEIAVSGADGPVTGIKFHRSKLNVGQYAILLNGAAAPIRGVRFEDVETSSEVYLLGDVEGVNGNIFMRQQARSSGNELPYAGGYLTGDRYQNNTNNPAANTLTVKELAPGA